MVTRRFLLLLLPLFLIGCGQAGDDDRLQTEFQGQTMGTTYSVKVAAKLTEDEKQSFRAGFDRRLAEINQSMSTYIPDSELSLLNKSNTPVFQAVSRELFNVLSLANQVYLLSDKAFDPSVGPLVNLWGFGPDVETEFPADKAIKETLKTVGFDKARLDERKVGIEKPADMYIDLSAIAKGYAVDELAKFLDQRGQKNYLVEIGGELRSRGNNAKGEAWRIAIEKPSPGVREVYGILNVSDQGMATSGDYRNFFEKDGKRYSHTIDPRTGYPVAHSLVSVTVLAEDAATADALATAMMVLGTEAGYGLAEEHGLSVWFIESVDGKLVDKISPKMQTYRVH